MRLLDSVVVEGRRVFYLLNMSKNSRILVTVDLKSVTTRVDTEARKVRHARIKSANWTGSMCPLAASGFG